MYHCVVLADCRIRNRRCVSVLIAEDALITISKDYECQHYHLRRLMWFGVYKPMISGMSLFIRMLAPKVILNRALE
jgi:hypothetical protein